MSDIAQVSMKDGRSMPTLGLGTWRIGERKGARAAEIDALRLGITLGMSLVDTAEMYGDGGAEEVVGEAIAGQRDGVFLVSKVYPHNATRRGVVSACKRSLARLRVHQLDLYLLHWRGDVPVADTVAGFESLREQGLIRAWGVSNFDLDDMQALMKVPGGNGCAANQVLYHLGRRGIEFDLLPWCRERGIAVMAYSPVDQGRLPRNSALQRLATAQRTSAAQLAIAWLLAQTGVVVIPKAADAAHVRDNRAAADLRLDEATLEAIDRAFPPPRRATPLAML
jgi:diketogulonate reductase-like aldo/keto reductase